MLILLMRTFKSNSFVPNEKIQIVGVVAVCAVSERFDLLF